MKCLQTSDKRACRAFLGQYLIASISVAMAQITLAIDFIIFAIFVTLMVIFLLMILSHYKNLAGQIINNLDLYTALIFGGCLTALTSIAVKHRTTYLLCEGRPLAGLRLPTSEGGTQQARVAPSHLSIYHIFDCSTK